MMNAKKCTTKNVKKEKKKFGASAYIRLTIHKTCWVERKLKHNLFSPLCAKDTKHTGYLEATWGKKDLDNQ